MRLILLLSQGLVVTIQIFVMTLLFAIPLGMVITFGTRAKNRIIKGIVGIYISIMRGTP